VRTIASKEVPSAASVTTLSARCPLTGKRPLGTALKSQTVPTVIASEIASAVRRWRTKPAEAAHVEARKNW